MIGLLSEALSCNDKFGCFAAGAIIEVIVSSIKKIASP